MSGAIRAMLPGDIEQVVSLHVAVLPEGFLPRLGPAVLVQTYAAALDAPETVALVAQSGGEIAGFLLATADTRALFRRALVRRGGRLLLAVVRALVRQPTALWCVLETLRYPARRRAGASGGHDAELISLGVSQRYRSAGYGAALIRALDAEFLSRGIKSYMVSAYADNEHGNAFYGRLGFEFTDGFNLYGRLWTLYRRHVPARVTPDVLSPSKRGAEAPKGRVSASCSSDSRCS